MNRRFLLCYCGLNRNGFGVSDWNLAYHSCKIAPSSLDSRPELRNEGSGEDIPKTRKVIDNNP